MIKGIGILELIIALTVGLGLLTIVIANMSESGQGVKKIAGNQERLEAIFHTVDTIKSDLNKCGMRLQEAARTFGLTLFSHSTKSMKLLYGLADTVLLDSSAKGEEVLAVSDCEFFNRNRRVLLYNLDPAIWEFNQIKEARRGQILLKTPLQNDFDANSPIIALREIEYRYYEKELILKRKTDNGYFQPLLEEVSDFYLNFFGESLSVIYRIEVNKKEQIRGYIFLNNMV